MSHPTHHFIVKRDFGRHGWGYCGDDTYTIDDAVAALIESFDGSKSGVTPSMQTVLVLEIDGNVVLNCTEEALEKIDTRTVWEDEPDGSVSTVLRARLAA